MRNNKYSSKERVLLNSSIGMSSKVIIALLGLLLRRIFLLHLGAELSGLSGVFLNIIEFLNLSSAGFITAIIPRLYNYNAENNYDGLNNSLKISIEFYVCISCIILIIGFVCSFFVQNLIANNPYTREFLQLVFMLQVLTHCVRLLLIPWSTLITVREQAYISIGYELCITIGIYILQAISVITLKNYIFYLIICLIGQLILFFILIRKSYSLYDWLNLRHIKKIIKLKNVLGDLRYTIPMQISNFIFMSTDCIVISSVLGLISTNYYTNYMTITMTVLGIYTMLQSAVNTYFGNRIRNNALCENKKRFIFLATFIYFIFGILSSTVYINVINDFIELWLGEEYRQSITIAILFGVYMFIQMTVGGVQNYLANLGLFNYELKANMSGAIINLLISIILINYIGIEGVLLGTIIGNIIRYILRTDGCFKDIGKGCKEFYFLSLAYIFIFLLTVYFVLKISGYVVISNLCLRLFIKALISSILAFIISFIFLFRRWELKEMLKLLNNRFFYRNV